MSEAGVRVARVASVDATQETPTLSSVAREVRELVVQTTFDAGSGHIGAALSQADLLVALYHRVLRLDPANPRWDDRDRFVLSKGHGGLGLACVLASRGFVPREDLKRFGETGFPLGMHMDHAKVPGIEASTGSLGHGLGIAVGMALGARARKQSWRTYCLLSDGELYEGSTWEAAMAASGFRLGNLTAIVDRNRLTMDGFTEDEMPLEPVAKKLEAFGWEAREIDGHDCEAIVPALLSRSEKPIAVIARTVKGKGVDFMEDVPKWHYGALDTADYARALQSVRRS